MKFKFATGALMLVLSSCASTPNLDYHTLDMSPSGKAAEGLNLVVDRFQTTEMLNRTQIVIQQTPTRIEYYATDRWASSVGEMVQRKLAAEFGPVVEGNRTVIVSGRVLAFEQVDTGAGPQARARLEITIRDGGAKRFEEPLLEKTYEESRTADANSVDVLVLALSRAIEAIAAEIVADAAGL